MYTNCAAITSEEMLRLSGPAPRRAARCLSMHKSIVFQLEKAGSVHAAHQHVLADRTLAYMLHHYDISCKPFVSQFLTQ